MPPQREWLEKDYYGVLGVPQSATDKEITRAYRKLAKQYHPDANPGSEDRFKELSAAYDVLGDDAKRKEYDELRRLGPSVFGGGVPGGFGGGGATFRIEDIDLSDLLGGLGGFSRRGRGGRSGAGPQRGADLEAGLHLSFDDAIRGVTTSVHVTGEGRCETCHGTGAAPGTSPVTCPRCGGKGVLDENQGLFSLSHVCPECGGNGTKITKACKTCKGTGVTKRAREVKVRIPPGVEDGQRIRVKGRGAPGRNNAPAGDLYVLVQVAPHPFFGRSGSNLTLLAPLTFPEAALGATIRVPTLDEPVSLRIPAGTPAGKTFRVKGRGVPASGHKSAGDLLVTVDVVVPAALTDEQRAAVEELARVVPAAPRDRLLEVSPVTAFRSAAAGDPSARAVYVISVAAEIAGVHPQTLRVYERRGLLDPWRTGGGSRRYSERDISKLRRIQDLTAAGLNLEGVRQVLELEAEVERLRHELDRVRAEARDAVQATHRQYRRDLVPLRQLPEPARRSTRR